MQHRHILFFAEAATLAHVARPIVLANRREGLRHKLVSACNDRYRRVMVDHPWQTAPPRSIRSQRFFRRLAGGTTVYDPPTSRRYVANDINRIERVKLDLIAGDFRLSLSVSARFVGLPYITIMNAYWSPFIRNMPFPLSVSPLSRCVPLTVAQPIFDAVRMRAFSVQRLPLNRFRREHGCSPLGNDLRLAYTDYTLYSDSPAMLPVERLTPHHRFLGPVLWAPPVSTPNSGHDLQTEKLVVYVPRGSSGPPKVMRTVIDAVAELRTHGLFGSAAEKTGP